MLKSFFHFHFYLFQWKAFKNDGNVFGFMLCFMSCFIVFKDPRAVFRNDYFKNSFYATTIIEWNSLDSDIRNCESLALFKKHLLALLRPSANSAFHRHNLEGLKLTARLLLGLSHLRFHKFKHSFTLN